ncbi:MAG TPA: YHS domain-containing protein [Pyrinomonadaceae bacterium]|nr:YHS domain-containing protein [Pyrinomonadaceae bacterium]
MFVKDRVCGMEFDERDAKESHVHEGGRYHFCSAGCRAEFERHPEEYADKAGVEGRGE